MPLSAVMSIYRGDRPNFFKEAVDSLLLQTVPAAELIVAVDGPIGPDLENSLERIKDLPSVQIVRLATNQGPGASRHAAILKARHDIIAVMDADDISVPVRFERQLGKMQISELDVIGGFIKEFDKTPGDLPRIREVPQEHTDIMCFGRWRYPMNHVTIMFRRKAYMNVGGYHALRGVEDYDLYYRMFMAGAKFANIPEVLVHVRGGVSILARRRGLPYLCQELALFRRMRKSGYLNVWQWTANSVLRIVARTLPPYFTMLIYQLLRK